MGGKGGLGGNGSRMRGPFVSVPGGHLSEKAPPLTHTHSLRGRTALQVLRTQHSEVSQKDPCLGLNNVKLSQ
ncbi:hypothetical protein JTE90_019813 [Oedothorax gibbosus]|uniref:Uncharacterized protein n=1 Tax=Oedothorax gibbosus TaxID=931172 RepID=A0AAV6V7N0_9ARAC|nr:hypothetical protein JTE90_019813 [Oedothorax gibbosus]